MKRLDRYVSASFLGAWMAALVFFIGLYLVIHFFNKIENLSDAANEMRAKGFAPWVGFCRYYALNIPFILVEILPFTILMGAMWAVQQMARKNELVSVLAAGVSLRRLAFPLLLGGFLISLGFTVVKEELLPILAAERHEMEQIFKGKKDDNLKNLDLFHDGEGHLINLQQYDVQGQIALGVSVRTSGKPLNEGLYVSEARFDPKGAEGPGFYVPAGATIEGAITNRRLPTDLTPRDVEIASRSLQHLPVADLKELLRRYPGRGALEILLHAHYAYPLRTLVLLLLGLPLVLRTGRRAPYIAVGLSLLVSVAFFAVQSVIQEMGRRGELLNPVLGAWLPIVLFGAAGLLTFESTPT